MMEPAVEGCVGGRQRREITHCTPGGKATWLQRKEWPGTSRATEESASHETKGNLPSGADDFFGVTAGRSLGTSSRADRMLYLPPTNTVTSVKAMRPASRMARPLVEKWSIACRDELHTDRHTGCSTLNTALAVSTSGVQVVFGAYTWQEYGPLHTWTATYWDPSEPHLIDHTCEEGNAKDPRSPFSHSMQSSCDPGVCVCVGGGGRGG